MAVMSGNMQIELDHIYNEDCLVGMKQIPDGTIDAVICDLPYGTTDCAWDSVIPMQPLWEQYKRILKHQGSVLLFGSEPFSTMLRMSNLDWYKYDWIWQKNVPTGFQHAKNMPMKDYEIISVFSAAGMGHANLLGNNRMTYNPQGCMVFPERGGEGMSLRVVRQRLHKNRVYLLPDVTTPSEVTRDKRISAHQEKLDEGYMSVA